MKVHSEETFYEKEIFKGCSDSQTQRQVYRYKMLFKCKVQCRREELGKRGIEFEIEDGRRTDIDNHG